MVKNVLLMGAALVAATAVGTFGSAVAAGTPAMKFANTVAEMTLDASGCVSSLRERRTGRELVESPEPFATVTLADGSVRRPLRLAKRGENRFACIFPDNAGEAEFSVSAFAGGWTVKVEKLTSPQAKTLDFARLAPACRKWKGSFANAWSDEKSAVAVRAGGIVGEPSMNGGALSVRVDADRAQGLAAAVAAGPRTGFREQLKAMTRALGAPESDCGGAWSMGSGQARRSYVFASVRDGDIDYWIDLAKRSGFSIIHLYDGSWSGLLGPYPVNPKAFPGGIGEMKRAADKVHAAGLQLGIHSLTGCISPKADWIHPVCDTNLVADHSYTLAAPLTPDAGELTVAEPPGPKHSTVFTYSSNGNVLRIGGELLQYDGIRRERPYAFTGLKRGAFGTRKTAGTIPAGTRVDYLHQRYIAFYPNPDSPLADRLASRLAEVYNTCGLDDFYFDGSEGMGTRYGIDAMRHLIFRKFKRCNGHSPSVEASCQGANNWWFQTRIATADHPVWGVKRFHDWHLKWAVEEGRNANFLEPQMGWWAPRTAVPWARGHFPDEMEYFAGKNAGHDAAMSIQSVTARPLPVGVKRQLAILGWYERARLARAFTWEVAEFLARPRTEGRLRQDADGTWRFTQVRTHVHRAGLPWTRGWRVEGAEGGGPAILRVEALYGAASPETGRRLAGPEDFAKMKTASANGVKVEFDPARKDLARGRVFRLAAVNREAPQNGAWARAKLDFDFPGLDLGARREAFGAWVKGDGSGALLNLQLTTPPEFHHGTSEHYLRLDFTGWRYVTMLLRERDASLFDRYLWPYGGYATIYRTRTDPAHIASFSAYLNDIPAGRSAAVEIGEVTALETTMPELRDAKVVLNGVEYALPFRLAAGEYAELVGRTWTKYSEQGTAVRRVRDVPSRTPSAQTKPRPEVVPGANLCAFRAPEGARAEVTLFELGRSVKAFRPLTAAMKRTMRTEAVEPFEFQPSEGLTGPRTLRLRPGEKAKLSVEVQGPVADLALSFGAAAASVFRETLEDGESLVCRDGRSWKVVETATGRELRAGRLDVGIPLLTRTVPFRVDGQVPPGRTCVVELLKEYQ